MFTEEECKILFTNKKYVKIIPVLIEKTHFNGECPENFNIYYPDLNSKYCNVYKDNKWDTILIDELIDFLFNRFELLFFDQFALHKYIKNDEENEPTSLARTLSAEESKKNIENTKQEIKLLLYNKNFMVKDVFNTYMTLNNIPSV